MNDEVVKLHQEIATRNSRAAVNTAAEVRKEMDRRLKSMDTAVSILAQRLDMLEKKYCLLLTKNFKGGSTSGGNG